MYKVDVYLRVRRAVMVDGMSIREASRASLSPGESDRSGLDPSFFCVKCVEARARGEHLV